MGCARNTTTEIDQEPAGGGYDCPAEAITRRIARVLDRLDDLDRERTPELAGEALQRNLGFERHLQDVPQALAGLLEWSPASSLAGVCGQALQLSDLVDSIAFDGADPYETSKLMARFRRLHRLIVRGLVEIGGLDAAELGVKHFTTGDEGHNEAIGVVGAVASLVEGGGHADR